MATRKKSNTMPAAAPLKKGRPSAASQRSGAAAAQQRKRVAVETALEVYSTGGLERAIRERLIDAGFTVRETDDAISNMRAITRIPADWVAETSEQVRAMLLRAAQEAWASYGRLMQAGKPKEAAVFLRLFLTSTAELRRMLPTQIDLIATAGTEEDFSRRMFDLFGVTPEVIDVENT